MDGEACEVAHKVEQKRASSGYRWLILLLTCGLCFLGNFMQYQVAAYATVIMPQMEIHPVGSHLSFWRQCLRRFSLVSRSDHLEIGLGPK